MSEQKCRCMLCHFEIEDDHPWGILMEHGPIGLDEEGTDIGKVHTACYEEVFDEEDDE